MVLCLWSGKIKGIYHCAQSILFIITIWKAGEMVQEIKSIYFCRGQGFDSQNLHGSSKMFVTPVPEELEHLLASLSTRHAQIVQAHMLPIHMCRQHTHMHTKLKLHCFKINEIY